MTAPVTPENLTTDFPEFGDVDKYPIASITYWLAFAVQMVNQDRWGTLYTQGIELFAAHNIVLEARAAKTSRFGGPPGLMTGPVASKQVDKLNVSYDPALGVDPKDGHWNLTEYGARFIQTAALMGSGGMIV